MSPAEEKKKKKAEKKCMCLFAETGWGAGQRGGVETFWGGGQGKREDVKKSKGLL